MCKSPAASHSLGSDQVALGSFWPHWGHKLLRHVAAVVAVHPHLFQWWVPEELHVVGKTHILSIPSYTGLPLPWYQGIVDCISCTMGAHLQATTCLESQQAYWWTAHTLRSAKTPCLCDMQHAASWKLPDKAAQTSLGVQPGKSLLATGRLDTCQEGDVGGEAQDMTSTCVCMGTS